MAPFNIDEGPGNADWLKSKSDLALSLPPGTDLDTYLASRPGLPVAQPGRWNDRPDGDRHLSPSAGRIGPEAGVRREAMSDLTVDQMRGADAAALVSRKKFEWALRHVKDKTVRYRLYAEQAEEFVRAIDDLGIPPTSTYVPASEQGRSKPNKLADLCRMSVKNVRTWERLQSQQLGPPHERPMIPQVVRQRVKQCPVPGCAYVGPAGTCPDHD